MRALYCGNHYDTAWAAPEGEAERGAQLRPCAPQEKL